MLISTLDGVRSFIINNLSGFDVNNCDIENVLVFDNILQENDVVKCIVIGMNGLEAASQESEFGGFLFKWNIIINCFFTLWGSEADRHVIILAGYQYLDDFLDKVKNNSTLDGVVMDAVVSRIHPPLTYNRSEMQEYFMLTVELTVTENI